MSTCYYKILGVSQLARSEEIKRAFRLLALRWHPDRNPHDPQAAGLFRLALEAYETLVDPTARSRYDRVMGYGRSPGKNRREAFYSQEEPGVSLEDVLQECFGISVKGRRGAVAYDLRFDLQVPRRSLRSGHYENICYGRRVFCRECDGGASRRSGMGCGLCDGSGELMEMCSVNVWIPEGSGDGTRLRISGAGDDVREMGRRGDVVVVLHVVDL